MVDRTLFCAICGGPIRTPTQIGGSGWSDDVKWQARAMLLSDPAKEFEKMEQHYRAGKRKNPQKIVLQDHAVDISRQQAVVVGPELCVVKGTGEEVRPNFLAGFYENDPPSRAPYSIATHEACVNIALRVTRSPRIDIHVRSLRTLWKVLRTRFDARDNEYMGSTDTSGPHYVVMDHGYYMPLGFADDYSVWDGDDEHWVVADPVEIPDSTSQVISNIETLEPESANPMVRSFRERFLSLPTELRDRIILYMGSFDGLSTQCTRLLPQEAWRDILLEKRYLPFMWDLDEDVIKRFCQEKAQDGRELNWELLVRKLSTGATSEWKHYESLEAELQLKCYPDLKVPKGLRNRRRIWQLVEEMYVGDVLPVARSWLDSKQMPSMPRYWDEYGEHAYPVVRIAGLPE